jgi:RNA polymerase sigma factor (sigma-70 family)
LKPYNDLEIIQGIRERDNKILEYLYNEYFGLVYDVVSQNNGNEDDARDVLQEAIVLIYRKIKNESLELNSSFKTYFYSVARNIWAHELRHRNTEIHHIMKYTREDSGVTESHDPDHEQQQRYRLYQEHFRKLGKECRRVLRMFLNNCSMEHIAQQMGYKSKKFVKKKKYKCKEQLVRSIKKDNRFNRLL